MLPLYPDLSPSYRTLAQDNSHLLLLVPVLDLSVVRSLSLSLSLSSFHNALTH